MHNKKAKNLADAIGTITYNMTNDFLFRYILQKNEKVLRGLICALLHLKPKQIRTITITNPINLSENIEGKDFILDINIELNNNTYKMLNVKNHHTYSDKFVLSVVDLSKIELATEDDDACGLTYWARLFKATTWEELKMLAKGNEYLEAAAESIFMANAEDMVRQRCRARQEAERYERTVARDMLRLKEENAQLTTDNAQLATDNAQLATDNAQLATDNAQLATDNAQLATDNAQLAANNAKLTNHIQNMESQMEQMAIMIKDLQKQLNKEL